MIFKKITFNRCILKNKYIKFFIKVIISLSLIFYLLNRIGFEKFEEIFTDVDILWLITALIFVTTSNLLGVLQWRLLLKSSGINISYPKAFTYYYNGLFFNNFLISNMGGDIFRIYDISKHSGKNSTAISTVFLDRFMGLLAMSVLALTFGIVSVKIINSSYILFPVSVFFAFITFVVLFFYFKKFAKIFQTVSEKILPKIIFQKLREVYNGINYFKNHRKLIFFLLFVSLLIQSLRISTHYAAALALNADGQANISIWYFFIFVPIIFIISLMPISIGGLGVRESMGVLFFGYVGISSGFAFSIEFLAYVIGIMASLPGGLAFLFRKHGEVKDGVEKVETI